MKIAIVVGHRKSRKGAYGNMGIPEWDYWSMFTKELIANIKPIKGIKPKVFYRQNKKGYTRNMKELHSRLDAWGADVSVELHFNGSSNKKASGHSVLFASKKGGIYAKMLNDRFNEYLPHLRDRGIVKVRRGDRGAGFLRRGKSLCILSEPFFGSHQHLYLKKGKYYEDLMSAFIAFLNDVAHGERV